ncbi:MAG: NUDIX hydrolase [Proteobacteria bacterium]|nr:NUDIX hydrolase [Pseudomonadota bacterium]
MKKNPRLVEVNVSMSRAALLKSVERYASRYPEEQATIVEFQRFVRANENCFDRNLREGHVTGSSWILDRPHKHCLLTHHRKLNRWLQLGGHADGDSQVARVATREAEEESGLGSIALVSGEIFDIDIHLIPERKHEPAHYHFDVRYLFEGDYDEPLVVSEESHELAWVPLSGIADYTEEESILRMVRKTG